MRSFKAHSKFDPSVTQPEIYSPSRHNYQNRIMNVTETSKNKNRTQQIVMLHQEFEDLKKKIKEVENKNQKIIEKIHRQCNFKKKTPQTFDANGEGPIVYYEKKDKSQHSQKSGMSVDDSNKSDQSEYEFRQKKPTAQRNSVQSNKHLSQQNFQSMQYTRNDFKNDQLKKKYSKVTRQEEYEEEPDSREMIEDEFEEQDFQMQQSHQTYHHLEKYNHSGKSSAKKSAIPSSYPVSQTHMGYGGMNHSTQIPQINEQFRHSQQLFNPTFATQEPSRISQHSTNPNSSLLMYQLEESLKIEKEKTAYLELELKNKQFEILNVKKQYNKLLGQFQSVQMILEDCIEQFFENTVKKGFFQIDKTLKKYENRLRNMAIYIKDEYEEVKSSRLIKEHQLRRSYSRSKRDLSPVHNTSIHSVIAPAGQSAKIPRPGSSQGSGLMTGSNGSGMMQIPQPQNIQPSQTSLLQQQATQLDKRSRISQQSRKNKEFEEIVEKYEDMINSKRGEISKLEHQKRDVQRRNEILEKELELKEVEVKEFKQRLEELDKLMSEMDSQGPIQSRIPKKAYRISSTESNLLEDIEHQDEEHKFEELYNELKQQYQQKSDRLTQLNDQMQIYEKKITEYEFRFRDYETKIRKLEQANSSESIKVSQKSDSLSKKQLQDSIKQHLNELHQLEITHKDSQILKYKDALTRVQKKLVEKDCECISLNNKVKKLDGVNQLNLKKIEEYEKLLNHYQLNASVDMGESWGGGNVLDRSICNEVQAPGSMSTTGFEDSARKSSERHVSRPSNRSQNNTVTITRSELESLEFQLKEMSEEILQMTKKLKLSQKGNGQKQLEIEKLLQEIQMNKVELNKYSQINSELKSRVAQLEEEINELKTKSFDKSQQQEDVDENNDDSKEWGKSHKSQEAQSLQQKSHSKNRPVIHKKRHSDIEPYPNQLLGPEPSRKPSEDLEALSHLLQTNQRLQEQLKILKSKNLQLSAQYNNLKTQHLELSRTNITIKKNNEYLQESLADREQKYQKCKREAEEIKVKNAELTEKLHVKEEELLKEKHENCQKINELEKQWHQFEEEITKNNQPQKLHDTSNLHESRHSQLMRSSRYNMSESSLLLSSTIHNKTSHYLQEQNEYLTIKLKQAEATIEIHNLMEQKVVDEYKANVERLKAELKEKGKELEQARKELEVIGDAKRRLEVLYESSKNYLTESRVSGGVNRKRQASDASVKKSQNNEKKIKIELNQQNLLQSEVKDLSMEEFPSYNEDANNSSMLSQEVESRAGQNEEERMYPYERIIELEGELKEAKDINKKLEEMEEQLFKQIRLKEEEKKDLLKLLDQKNLKIQELEEIVQLKDNNVLGSSHLGSHIMGSHISSSNYKSSSNPKHSAHNLSQRESMHSHSSLRYSGITHLKTPINYNNPSVTNLQVMGASQMGTSQRFQIQLSQTGSQMLDKSYVTNISQIFQKEQFPYEKVQLKRKQQIKLFQKTASYIKSLKQSINQKNKKIKLLEKKIESLKSTHHGPISKELENKYQISTRANENISDDVQMDFQSVFKDYESVQLERKKASHNKRYKNLEHQWKLAIEENNVLSNQVEVLQEELEKAEEQENTILVMKDLYKDEIKKLLAKNQQQTTYYEDLLAKEKAKVEESQSVHNLETIKQLFLKVMDSIIVMESEKSKKKREEKKKDLEQFFKIFASLCAVEEVKKNAILEGIKKMTLNIVLAEEGRGASKGKD